jgi:transcriptional regulator with XRE-family HTH domain
VQIYVFQSHTIEIRRRFMTKERELLGHRIRRLRQARGFATPRSLAEQIGVSKEAVWGWETYPNRTPRGGKVFAKLAQVLGVSEQYLREGGAENDAAAVDIDQEIERLKSLVAARNRVPSSSITISFHF